MNTRFWEHAIHLPPRTRLDDLEWKWSQIAERGRPPFKATLVEFECGAFAAITPDGYIASLIWTVSRAKVIEIFGRIPQPPDVTQTVESCPDELLLCEGYFTYSSILTFARAECDNVGEGGFTLGKGAMWRSIAADDLTYWFAADVDDPHATFLVVGLDVLKMRWRRAGA